MNNKVLLFLVAVLLLGGVFVLSKNQNKTAPVTQDQQADLEKGDEGDSEEALEDGTEEERMEEDVEEGEDAEEDVEVMASETGFEPQTVTIKAGTKVVWTNTTGATADVSSAQHPTHLVYPPLNLGNFEPGATVELVFEEPGEYKYHDHLNPTKFGTVVVE